MQMFVGVEPLALILSMRTRQQADEAFRSREEIVRILGPR